MNLTQFNEIQISDREMLDENIFDKEEGGIDEINVPDRLSGKLALVRTFVWKWKTPSSRKNWKKTILLLNL